MANRQQTYASIEKMLATLDDPFTRFLDPPKYKALKTGTKGAVTGVGLEVAYSTGSKTEPELMVVAPAPKSPAARAGVEPGDILLSINGESIQNASLYTIGEKLRGEKGTEVISTFNANQSTTARLGIHHNQEEEKTNGNRHFDKASIRSSDRWRQSLVSREEVVYNPVIYHYCTGIPSRSNLAYIQILRFTNQTAADVQRALQKLKGKSVGQLLLDLRNNGGGSFPAGISVAKMFLDDGDIVLIADTEGVRDIISAESTALDSTTPMTVLVNRGTASASEVLSGAIQDNNRGLIAGEASFGKGLIQTLVPLSDGSAITVTTAQYQTPSGRDINKSGIQPDIPLSPDDAFPFGDDEQFCEDVKRAERTTLKIFP